MTEMFFLLSFRQHVCLLSCIFANAYTKTLKFLKRPSYLLALGFKTEGVLTQSPTSHGVLGMTRNITHTHTHCFMQKTSCCHFSEQLLP